jgi:putative ABC transport system substrate-binding protein
MEEPTIDLLRQVGSKIGVTFSVQRVRQAAEFDSAFAAFAREGVQVIGPFFSPLLVAEAARIVALSRRYGWPDIGSNVAEVELGGFLAYSVNVPDLYRRAAGYADRILRGEKPGELPIQQPIQYDLVINLRAAKALGRPVPQSLLLQATRLIE